jgi:hypothetical protein
VQRTRPIELTCSLDPGVGVRTGNSLVTRYPLGNALRYSVLNDLSSKTDVKPFEGITSPTKNNDDR